MRHAKRSWLFIPSPLLGPASWQPVATRLVKLNQPAIIAAPDMTTTAEVDHITPWVNEILTTDPPADDLPTVVVAHSAACPRAPLVVDRLIGKGWPIDAMILVDGRFPDGRALTGSCHRYASMLDGMVRPDDYLPPWPRWWGSLVEGLVIDPEARDQVFSEAPPVPRSWFDQGCPVPELPRYVGKAFLSFGPGYGDAFDDARAAGWLSRRLDGDHLHQVVEPAAVSAALLGIVADLASTDHDR